MTGTTTNYKIPYPSGSDLVSKAPAQLQALAEKVDSALKEVDSRATTEGTAPIVVTTQSQLNSATANTGQIGYVTGDSTQEKRGPYIRGTSSWQKVVASQNYEAGFYNANTNANGVVAVHWERHTRAPSTMVVTLANHNVESEVLLFTPIVWTLEANYAQIRFRREDTHKWIRGNAVKFQWLAFWDYVE